MPDLMTSHASLRRDAGPVRHEPTGEIRVPIALQQLDLQAGETDLVLSRRQAEQLHDALTILLAPPRAALSAVR